VAWLTVGIATNRRAVSEATAESSSQANAANFSTARFGVQLLVPGNLA